MGTAADIEVPLWAVSLLEWFEPKIAAAIAEALRVAGDKEAVEKGTLSYRYGTVQQVFDEYTNVIIDGAQALAPDVDPVPVPCSVLTPAAEEDRVVVLFSPSGGALMLGPFVAGAGGGGGTIGGTLEIPPSIDLTATGEGAYEAGVDTVTSTLLTATFIEGSRPVVAVRFLRDGVVIHSGGTTSPQTFTDDSSRTGWTNITTTTVYTVEIDAGSVTYTSDEARFDFVNPYYYGVSATDALGAGVSALTKLVAVEGPQTVSFVLDATPRYIYFAVPPGYDPILAITNTESDIAYGPEGFKDPVTPVTVATVADGAAASARYGADLCAAVLTDARWRWRWRYHWRAWPIGSGRTGRLVGSNQHLPRSHRHGFASDRIRCGCESNR